MSREHAEMADEEIPVVSTNAVRTSGVVTDGCHALGPSTCGHSFLRIRERFR